MSTFANAPVLIDLYCCAGGATKGYQRAGFFVIGIDRDPQRNYCGDAFIQMDVLEFLCLLALHGHIYIPGYGRLYLRDIVAFHASPPCQTHSAMTSCRPGLREQYEDFIAETRDVLDWFGLPYVIENVPGAPLRADVTLCGQMFGRELYRHRLFEIGNWPVPPQPEHPAHVIPASRAGHWEPGTIMSVSGHIAPVAHARKIMDMDWTNREELAEAIPPYYAEHIGFHLMGHLKVQQTIGGAA